MKKRIRLRFVGKDWDKLPPGTVPHPFDKVLPDVYELDFGDNPDFVISKESRDFYRSALLRFPDAPVRILFAGEAFVPDFNIFDYAIGFDHLDFGDRYFRMHTCNFFSFEFAYGTLDKSGVDLEKEAKSKESFCNFIYSNSSSNNMRRDLFHLISKVGHVDAAGKLLNNCGKGIRKSDDWRASKVEFQRKYRFTIAAENSRYPGYTTEKLLNPMFSLSIPIYYGNPRVGEYFNSKSFVNCHEFESLDEMVAHVARLEKEPELYLEMLKQPWMTPDQQRQIATNDEAFGAYLRNIFDQEPAAARRRGDGTWVWRFEKTLRDRVASHDIMTKNKLGSFLARSIGRLF